MADIETVVRACPSGALQLADHGHLLPEGAEITVSRNGPYWIAGPQVNADSGGRGGNE